MSSQFMLKWGAGRLGGRVSLAVVWVMLFTLLLLLFIPDIVDRFTSHVTNVYGCP